MTTASETPADAGERAPGPGESSAGGSVRIDLLQPSSAHLELALEASGTGVWTCDLRDDTVGWSPRSLSIHGLAPGEGPRTAHDYFSLFHPQDRERVQQAIRTAAREGRGYDCEARIVRPDGEVAWVSSRGHAVGGGADGTACVIGTLQDITVRVVARGETEGLYRELARQLPGGAAFVVDRQLRYRLAEGPALSSVGLGTDDFQGRLVQEMVEPGRVAEVLADYRQALDGRPFVRKHQVGDRQFITHGVPLKVEGETVSALAVSYDISGHVASDTLALKDAERVHLALAAGAIVGTWVWDIVNDRFMADELFARSFGLGAAACRDGLTLEQVSESIHPGDLERVQQAVAQAVARGGAYRCEYRVRRGDGHYHWVEANGRVEQDATGRPLRFPGVLLDIQDRRAAQAERDAAHALLRSFLEAVPGAMYAKDRDGRLLLANRGVAEIAGKPLEAILGRTNAQFLDNPAQAAVIMATDARIMASGRPEKLEELVDLPDGTVSHWLSSKAPLVDADGRVAGLVGASVDITQRVAATAALVRSEALLAAVLDSLPAGVVIAAADGTVVRENAAHRALWGEQAQGAVRQPGELEGYWPQTGARIGAHEWGLARALREGQPVHGELVEAVPFDGAPRRVFLNTAAPVRDPAGTVIGAVAVELDVTASAATEQSLRARERELKSVADNTPDILARFDRDLRHVFVNAACERVLGRPASAIVGRSNREMGMPPQLCDEWEEALRSVFATGLPQTVQFAFEGTGGTTHWSSLLVPESVDDARLASVLTVARDVTERVVQERLLQDQDRRKDVFLATLAHELRNPLAPIRNGLSILRRTAALADTPAVQRTLDILERQVHQLVHLVDDLLDISRINQDKITLRLHDVTLQEVVAGAVEAARPAIEGGRHAVDVDLPGGPVVVTGDRTRLVQVLTNLLVNASKYSLPQGHIHIQVAREGDGASVRVRDRGLGIAPGEMPRIWNMFEQNDDKLHRAQGGLGIGLALVRKLVELHGGTVHASSPGLGAGSTFTVWLPAAGPREPPDGLQPVALKGPPPPSPDAARLQRRANTGWS